MNLRQMGKEELALILHGLRSIYVEDQKDRLEKMVKQIEDELAARGLRLVA